jgi:hypothetical protein
VSSPTDKERQVVWTSFRRMNNRDFKERRTETWSKFRDNCGATQIILLRTGPAPLLQEILPLQGFFLNLIKPD